MQFTDLQLDPAQLLQAIHNQLTNNFFTAEKAQAKRWFRALEAGEKLGFLQFSHPAGGDVTAILALDKTQYQGRLNFSAFRNILAAHLYRIAEKINAKEDLNIFSNQETGDMIYHIPGIQQSFDDVNVLVTGVENIQPGQLTVKLQFLDAKELVDAAPK